MLLFSSSSTSVQLLLPSTHCSGPCYPSSQPFDLADSGTFFWLHFFHSDHSTIKEKYLHENPNYYFSKLDERDLKLTNKHLNRSHSLLKYDEDTAHTKVMFLVLCR